MIIDLPAGMTAKRFNNEEIVIERTFSSKTTTMTLDHAKQLVKALNKLLSLDIKLCHYCRSEIEGEPVTEHEFHQDGMYCSKECLLAQMKEDEARLEE